MSNVLCGVGLGMLGLCIVTGGPWGSVPPAQWWQAAAGCALVFLAAIAFKESK